MNKKKHYLVYKTTCLLNGKIYIGQHQTYDPNDNYLGSGRELKVDIQKFGRENFTREILFDFDNFTDMDNKEKELVTEEFIAREDTYNVRLGGQNPDISDTWKFGRDGFIRHMKSNSFRKSFCSKVSEALKTRWREHPE